MAMSEVSTAAAPEGVLHRRIEFHLARRPHAAVAVGGGGFRMETLNPDAAGKAGAGAAVGGNEGESRKPEKGDAGGIDPGLNVARIYLGRIGAGLQNLGNTCYLNSVLQCLTYTEPFAAYLQTGKHTSSCRTSGFCALCALQKHVKIALQSTGKIVTPSLIVKNLRCISRSFRNSRQEDAHELMVNLLESMHKCCLPSGVPSESQSAYDKSLVHKIFGGRLRSQVKCTRCSYCSDKFDPFLDLSLDIAKATTLVQALKNFTEEELLDGGQKQYQCERCRQKVVAKKRFTVDKAPNVLTVHLKRFSPFNPREKIDKKVDFQPFLDLKPFVSDSKVTDFKYSLYGVLVHAGWNTQSGHYYCFVRTSSGMWHNLDDNKVCQVREADVLRQKAYMLFYVRDSIGNSMARNVNSTANFLAKKTSERISSLNGVTQNSVKAQTLSGSSPFGNKMHNTSNGYSTIFSNISAGHCSKNEVKGVDAAASQNNSLSSSTQALVPQNDGATLPTKSMQFPVNSQDTSSSYQHASFTNTYGKQTVAGRSLQEMEPTTDAGKNVPVASPIVNGASTLSKDDKLASQYQPTPLSKPTVHVNDTAAEFAAQTLSKKDSVVPNGVVPSTGCLTSSEKTKNLPESVGQANEIAKELPMIQNNTAPGAAQVGCRIQISSGGSVQSAVAASCNGTAAKKVNLKSKKFVRSPVVNMWLGSRQLLVASLKPGKKAKHKRCRRRAIACKDVANISCLGDSMSEQLTSTSATARSENIECTSSRRKHSRASARPQDDTQTSKIKKKVDGPCTAAGTSADIPKSGPSSSVVDQTESREDVDAKSAATQPVSVRVTDLKEATVPCWDEAEVQNTKVSVLQPLKRKSGIGYILDEWDEEYDRGKTKKVRKSKQDFGGPNPFQEEADYMSQRRMKQKSYQGKSWNEPNNTTQELRP